MARPYQIFVSIEYYSCCMYRLLQTSNPQTLKPSNLKLLKATLRARFLGTDKMICRYPNFGASKISDLHFTLCLIQKAPSIYMGLAILIWFR